MKVTVMILAIFYLLSVKAWCIAQIRRFGLRLQWFHEIKGSFEHIAIAVRSPARTDIPERHVINNAT